LVGPECATDWWHDPPQLLACWVGAGSDAVLAPAETWSDALGMDLSLVCVFHPLDVPASVDPRREFVPALTELESRHVAARTIDLHDDYPAGAIADCARDLPATMLALTTHARAGLSRAVLGSVAMDVVHRSPCPVLVLRQQR
jgi:nucleotide-binding universal stress UspA family protein